MPQRDERQPSSNLAGDENGLVASTAHHQLFQLGRAGTEDLHRHIGAVARQRHGCSITRRQSLYEKGRLVASCGRRAAQAPVPNLDGELVANGECDKVGTLLSGSISLGATTGMDRNPSVLTTPTICPPIIRSCSK